MGFKDLIKKNKEGPVTASPPEEEGTLEELNVASGEKEVSEAPIEEVSEQPKVIPVPHYLSQAEVNNMVIENNLMLKELISLLTDTN